jgi:hypothetical protein
MPHPARHRAGGFTLIEAALTTVIIGTGVLSILAAQQAYHIKNDWAQRTGTAMLLANELRELTLTLPMNDPFTGAATLGPEADELGITDYDDLDDFAGPVVGGVGTGLTFSPPINALRLPIDNMNGWSQQIRVENVPQGNIALENTPLLGSTNLMRVTVTVNYQPPNAQASTATMLTWVVGR